MRGEAARGWDRQVNVQLIVDAMVRKDFAAIEALGFSVEAAKRIMEWKAEHVG